VITNLVFVLALETRSFVSQSLNMILSANMLVGRSQNLTISISKAARDEMLSYPGRSSAKDNLKTESRVTYKKLDLLKM
jgi:hypothetical protein